jgi:flagellar hook-length control protein FliK
MLTERPRPDRLAPLSGVATEAELTAAGYVSEAPSVEKLVPEPKVERDLASAWKEVDPYVVRDDTAPRLTTSLPMTTVSESSVGTDRGLAAMITLPSVSASPADASLARPSATLSQTAEAVRVLVMPDPKLSADERVQAFAEAVGQRVLAQIRDDDWNVRLQLEPANMGTVDIDLTLRGTAVAANVSVANGEVRALLESGLPRLRDSLETAGLQLAGWTFGQSGSRPFNGSAQGWTAQAVRRHQAATGDDGVALAPLHAIAAKDPSSRAIDLFV